nr:UDP-N-acetylmuramate--L-alanine ligase [Candidatus Westeberhardia cardiocondylae]
MFLLKNKNFFIKIHKINNIHLVGIGGIGMSGIAKILFHSGYKISGSDLSPNKITKQLEKIGIKIFYKHSKKNIKNANVLVISSAVKSDNLEIVSAKKKNIPIIKRAEMLAELMRFHYGIAIAGTHGKTTTTSMIINIYIYAGINPTFINGGISNNCNIHAHLGKSKYFITEADESDASFLYLKPIIAIITNIEADHLETYQKNFKILKQTFINFLQNIPFYGYAIICIDDPIIKKLLPHIRCKIITYGFSNNADFRINKYQQKETCINFDIYRKKKPKLHITLNTPGYHNALNASAAIAIATLNNIDDKKIIQAMSKFKNVNRRFENLGYHFLNKEKEKTKKILLIDDYGHHPTEINVTIQTIRNGWPNKRLVMIFQPHRYTRTKNLYEHFVYVLSKVDILLILNIYSVGEIPISGINSNELCKSIYKNKKKPILIRNTNILPILLPLILKNNDLLLIQGAGTIENITQKLINTIFKKTYT